MIKFGTGGWRAVIGEDFIKSNIQLVAKAVVSRIKSEHCENIPVAIGYDRRFLSREAMVWVGEVLASNGIKTLMIDAASPTPLVMYYTMAHKHKYGLMITASHNPSLYNGIKLFTEGGRDADEIVTHDIEERIKSVELNDTTAPLKQAEDLLEEGILEYFNPLNEYIDNILDKIDTEAIRHAHLHIAIDPLFGVSLRSLNTIFATCRCDIQMMHTEHDTLFAGKMPSPDENTVRTLQNYVVDYGIDLGIATDGDGDRIGIIDDKGQYINANEILSVLYYYFLEYKGMKTGVVRNLATTCVLDRIAEAYGQKCYEVPVGFKYISRGMRDTNSYIGGESSGGLTVMGHINGKDAIYAAALLVETIAKTGKKFSELLCEVRERFGYWYTVEENLRFRADRKQELMNRIYTDHDLPDLGVEISGESYSDGCKLCFKDGGWILIRFSGTEPLIRIFCEMEEKNRAMAKEICEKVRIYYNI